MPRNLLVIKGGGYTTITATQAGTSLYNPASISTVVFVSKKAQTLNAFQLPLTLKYTTSLVSIYATSSSGLPVTFTSANPSIVSIEQNKMRVRNIGTTTITAIQSGNNSYSSTVAWTKTITIEQADQTIDFTEIPPKTYQGPNFPIFATSNSGLPIKFKVTNEGVASVSGNTVTIKGAGTTQIVAEQDESTLYKYAFTERTLTVNKKTQSITFGELNSKFIDEGSFSLMATSTSGLPVVFSSSDNAVATINGNTTNLVGVGSCNITASQPGDVNFLAASPEVLRTLEVNVLRPTIAAKNIIISKVKEQSAFLTFSGGNGTNHLVVISAVTPVDFIPTNNVTYRIGNVSGNNRIVPTGTNLSILLGGLSPSTTYHIKIFTYNVSGSSTSYFTSAAPIKSFVTTGGMSTMRQQTDEELVSVEQKTFDVQVVNNPFEEYLEFIIEDAEEENATIGLLDINGRIIHQSIEQTNSIIRVEKNLLPGMYLLKVLSGKRHVNKKVIRL
jgi:hypothetical protein